MRPGLCMYANVDEGAKAFTLDPDLGTPVPDTVHTPTGTDIITKGHSDGISPTETPQSPPPTVKGATTPVESPSIPLEPAQPSVDTRKKYVSNNLENARPIQARVAWAWITTFIEVKHDVSFVAYDVDIHGNLICPPTEHAKEARAQIVKYVAEIFARQHRQAVFAAMLVKDRAFLMRWDRAGAIVATPFNYIAEPEKLLRFVYRIALAERSAQGYDTTASLASAEEIERFRAHRDALSRYSATQGIYQDSAGLRMLLEYVDEIFAKMEQYPIYKVVVYLFTVPQLSTHLSGSSSARSQIPCPPPPHGYRPPSRRM